jgi:Flp pilus assembly protein TadD
LAWKRLLDAGNEIALLGAPAVVLAAPTWRATGAWRAWRDPLWTPIALLAWGSAAIWFVPPRIGAARDWDLYVAVVLPAVLGCGEAARRAARAWPQASVWALTGRCAGLAAVVTACWVASQVDDRRAAQRLIVLQDARGTFSNFARGYANEALGIYYRTHDVAAAHAAYARAVQNNPNNPRYWNNLAMHDVMREDFPGAVRAWRRALELGMHHWYVYYNLAMAELELGNSTAALELGDAMVRRWPAAWQSWMGRGRARLQADDFAGAAADLERAWRLEPRQPEIGYALGMAQQSQGDMQAAAATYAAVLRLDPRHPAARRELDRIEGRSVPSVP